MKFKSKIGWWFIAVMVVAFIIPISLFLFAIIANVFILGILSVFFLLLMCGVILPFLNTYYVIEDLYLLVKCGYVYNLKIPFQDILNMKETHSPIGSAALSLDRLEIEYRNGRVLISPKDKKEFINQLKTAQHKGNQ